MADTRLSPARAIDIFGQVRQTLRREALFPRHEGSVHLYTGVPRVWDPSDRPTNAACSSQELADRLRALYQSLKDGAEAAEDEIGRAPGVVPTLRGRVGAVAISIFQRLLWWYTDSLKTSARLTRTHLQVATETVEALACEVRVNQLQIAALQEELRLLRETLDSRSENPR